MKFVLRVIVFWMSISNSFSINADNMRCTSSPLLPSNTHHWNSWRRFSKKVVRQWPEWPAGQLWPCIIMTMLVHLRSTDSDKWIHDLKTWNKANVFLNDEMKHYKKLSTQDKWNIYLRLENIYWYEIKMFPNQIIPQNIGNKIWYTLKNCTFTFI